MSPSETKDAISNYEARFQLARQDPFFVSRILERSISALGALATSRRWHAARTILQQHLVRFEELVCYCLGDLSKESVSYQLAFLLLIANHLEIPPARRLVFDPIHTDKDRQVLQMFGLTPLTWNEHGERRVHCRTLFYMPFAPFDLTDNVVRANWVVLHKIAIIGNRLDFVTGACFEKSENGYIHRDRAPATLAAQSLATEVVLWENDFETWLTQAANDCQDQNPEENRFASVLNATLTTFSNRQSDWPQNPPRRRGPQSKL